MLTIKKNKDIKLDIPKFTCDTNCVGSHLEEHPFTQLLNVYGFLCIIGKPGSGKTSLAISFMTQSNPKIYKKAAHHMIILMPQNSINSLKKNPFKKLKDIYHELNQSSINEIHNKIDEYSKNDEKTILFVDDMTADLKNVEVRTILKKLIFNRRHLKLNIIITAQVYNNLPMDIRKNITSLIMFKCQKKELENVFDELFENKKDKFMEVMRICYKNKNDFLFLNIASQRMFKNFDEIIINDSDNESDNETMINNKLIN